MLKELTLGGTVSPGDIITFTVNDTGLTGGHEAITYLVQSGDTLSSITSSLVSAVNADTNLQTLGVSASILSGVINISSMSSNTTTYSFSDVKGAMSIFANPNVIKNITIGGTVTVGDVLTITFNDASLSGGTEAVSYTVHSGDTLSAITSDLLFNVETDSNLDILGLTNWEAGSTLSLLSGSTNTTTYSLSTSSGATETMSQATDSNTVELAAIGGTKHTGDVLTITVHDSGISGGMASASYTVRSSDTLAGLPAKLSTAINSVSAITGIGVIAGSYSGVVYITSIARSTPLSYTKSLSGGATETITLSASSTAARNVQRVIGGASGAVFNLTGHDSGISGGGAETESYTATSGDTPHSIASTLATDVEYDTDFFDIGVTGAAPNNAAILSSNSLHTTTWTGSVTGTGTETLTQVTAPNGVENISLSGFAAMGRTVSITVYDSGLSGGQETVSYTLLAGNTLAYAATQLAAAINADTNLQAIDVSASSASAVVSIKSLSLNTTTYSTSVTGVGGGETVTFGTNNAGNVTATVGGTAEVGDST